MCTKGDSVMWIWTGTQAEMASNAFGFPAFIEERHGKLSTRKCSSAAQNEMKQLTKKQRDAVW